MEKRASSDKSKSKGGECLRATDRRGNTCAHFDFGAPILPDGKMVTLQECQRNMLCASISGQDRKHIEPGQHILRAKDGELLGKVVRVGSRRNFRNGLFKVTVKPLQKIEATSVVSKIVTEVIPGTISVPNSSVILEDDGFYVWKVDSENTATKVKVEVGHKSAGATEIKVGLKAGDQIVFRGAAQVAKYKKIKIMDTKKSSELQASAI